MSGQTRCSPKRAASIKDKGTYKFPKHGNKVMGSFDAKRKDYNTRRETWQGKADFLLSCIGCAVGLGNIWRFPYLCYKNGGGSFLIPYLVFLLCAGIPIFFLEISLGQFMGAGGIRAWDICPLFKGVGYASTIILTLWHIYYIVILAWALVYLYFSFSWTLPWSTCSNWWNTDRCFSYSHRLFEANDSYFAANTAIASMNNTLNRSNNSVLIEPMVDSVTEFWERRVLQISGGIDEPNGLVWDLTLALFICWCLTYFSVWKGVKLVGKIVYFTATFPYIILTILLVYGLTLPGAMDGVAFYLKPDFEKLVDAEVWVQAATQVFYSALLGFNVLVALGSYNDFHNNIYRDSFIIVAVNSGTSIFAGFAVFSVLGFMAQQQGVSVEDVAESGPGLIFIAYPKAITEMSLPWLWAILFFLMIMFVGFDSMFVSVEALLRIAKDMWPCLYDGWRVEMILAAHAALSFMIGLLFTTRGGIYVFYLFDYYSCSGMALMWVCLFETIAVGWFYGANRYYDNIKMMLGYEIGSWLKICWCVVTPIVMFALLTWFCSTFTVLVYNRDYVYPSWAQALGLCLSFSSMICIPIYAVVKLISSPGSTLLEKYNYAIRPVLSSMQIPTKWEDKILLEAHFNNVRQNESNRICFKWCNEDDGHLSDQELDKLNA